MSAGAGRGGVLRSFFWAGAESGLGMILSIGSLLGIARLIGVEEFGLGTLAYGFVVLASIAAMTLLHDVVVQRAELSNAHRVAAFKGSILIGLALGGLCIALAPLFAWLYEQPRLGWLMVGLAPAVLLDAVGGPFLALRRRALDFKGAARALLTGKLAGLCVGVTAAVMGAGAWAIVLQQLANSVVTATALVGGGGPLPRGPFSWHAFKDLIRFTSKLVASQVLQHGSERVFLAYVGYTLGVSAAGYWSLATRLVENITGIVGASLYQVGLAHFSPLQHDLPQLRRSMDAWLGWLGLGMVAFIAAGLLVAEPGIAVLLGPDWQPAAPAVAVMLVTTLLLLRRVLPSSALISSGRPEAPVRAQLVENLIAIPLLLVSQAPNVTVVAAIRLLRAIVGNFVVQTQLRRYLHVPLRHDFTVLAGQIATGSAAVAVGWWGINLLSGLGLAPLLAAVIAAVVAAAICIAVGMMLRPGLYHQLTDVLGRLRPAPEPETGTTGEEFAAEPAPAPTTMPEPKAERVASMAIILGALATAGWAQPASAAPPAVPGPMACAAASGQPAIHVAVTGDDRWSGRSPSAVAGRSDGPKRSLEGALAALAGSEIRTIRVGAGDYFIASALTVGGDLSGLAIIAEPGTRPVLHGGLDLRGVIWRAERDGTLSTAIDTRPGILDLHVDGRRQTQARWPDPGADPLRSGWLFADAATSGHEALQVRAGDWQALAAHPATHLHVVDARQWTSNNAAIAGLDPADRMIRLIDNPRWHELGPGSRFYLYGTPALIDRPGEWAWDGRDGRLHYRPAVTAQAGSMVVGATTDTLIRVSDASDVLIAGLELRDGSPHGGDRGPPWFQRGGGAIRVERSNAVTICDNLIENVGVGIRLSGVRGAAIHGNRVRRTASNGIFVDTAGPGSPSSDILILDNDIALAGQTFIESGGIIAYGLQRGVIARNLVQDTAQMGIVSGQIEGNGSDPTNGVRIALNIVRRANLASADGGGIKLFAAVQQAPFDTVIEDNWVDAMGQTMSRPDGSFFGPEERVAGAWPQPVSAGIYFDWRVSGATVRHNLVTDGWTGILLTNAANNLITGNVVWGGVGAAVALANWTEQDRGGQGGWRMVGNQISDNLFARTRAKSNAVDIWDPQTGEPAARFSGNVYAGPAATDATFLAQPAGRFGLLGARSPLPVWQKSRWSGGGEQMLASPTAAETKVMTMTATALPPLAVITAIAQRAGVTIRPALLDIAAQAWQGR